MKKHATAREQAVPPPNPVRFLWILACALYAVTRGNIQSGTRGDAGVLSPLQSA